MIVVLQRVREAAVEVDGCRVGAIGAGLLALVGVGRDDTDDEAAWMAGKIADLRVFEDESGKMNRSVREAGGAVLLVSQFTLYGDCRKGRRPSFDRAAAPGPGRALYEALAAHLRGSGLVVETGVFGAHMRVSLINDGPVTLILERAGAGNGDGA
jgi:D-tyrosyl-tRNA(Tyr) deacylase